MTKNELIAYMQSIITTNGNNEITGSLLDDVLQTIINVVWESFTQGEWGDCPLNFRGEINFGYQGTLTIHRGDVFVNAAIGGAVPEGSFAGDWIINLDEGEEDLLSVTIGESNEIWFYLPFGASGSGSMTAAQIRDALQTLTLLNRLNKSAILGADFAINRRGALQWDDFTVQGTMTDILPGDCWVYAKGSPSESDPYLNGDILVLLTSTPGTPLWTLTDTSKFWIIKAGHIQEPFTSAEKTKLAGIAAGADVTELANDTTPQLGGDLDVNTKKIVSVGNSDITIEPHGVGRTKVKRFQMTNVAGFMTIPNTRGDGSVTIDWSTGNQQLIELNGNTTLTFSPPPDKCALTLYILHCDDSNTYTITWPSGIKWARGVRITTTQTALAMDIVTLLWDGTSYYAMYGNDFKTVS